MLITGNLLIKSIRKLFSVFKNASESTFSYF